MQALGLDDTGVNMPTSACAQALTMPEIVALILLWVARDTDFARSDQMRAEWSAAGYDSDDDDRKSEYYGTKGVLSRCARVNKLWFQEAVPHIWDDLRLVTFPLCGFSGLTKALYCVASLERRRLYARCVQQAIVHGLPADERVMEDSSGGGETVRVTRADIDAMYAELAFPLLTELEMWMSGWGESSHVPKMKGHNVTELSLDPSFDVYPDTYRVCQDELASVLDEIPVSATPWPLFYHLLAWPTAVHLLYLIATGQDIFPDLEVFSVDDRCLAYPGAFDKFAKRMPKLRSMNHDNAVETLEYLNL